jgi:sugar-specific transcriptional regulator TrmB
MLTEILCSTGLSEKEAQTYLVLLHYGTRPTSFVAKKAQLNRGTAYVMLHALLAKGLVTKTTKRKVQYFAAFPPQMLLSQLERKAEDLSNAKTKLREALPALEGLLNPLASKPSIQYLEGKEGARTALETTLTAQDKTLRAFLSLVDMNDYIGAGYFHDYTKRRIALGYSLHAIRAPEKDKAAISRDAASREYLASKKHRRDVRYVSGDLVFPVTMYLFDNKIAVISSKEEDFSLIIESRELSEMQKKLFEVLWGMAAHSALAAENLQHR